MSDNPSYRGGQGQGQPGDEYYDYGRQGEEPRAPTRPSRAVTRRRALRRPATRRPAGALRPGRLARAGWLPGRRAIRRRPTSSARPPGTARRPVAATPTRVRPAPAGYGPPTARPQVLPAGYGQPAG